MNCRVVAALSCSILAACASKTEKATPGNANAVGIAIRVDNPDHTRNIYLGAYPSMPTGTLDKGNMVELGAAMTAFAYGWAFMYDNDSQILSRYSLGSDGKPQKDDAQLSFADVGAGQYITYAFVSATRAYIFNDPQAGAPIVAWNPTTMTLIEHASMENLALDANTYDESYYSTSRTFGNYQVATLEVDMDAEDAVYPKMRVLFIPNDSLAGTDPVTVVEDDRCGGSTALFVDAAGDLYVTGTAAYGAFQLFPTNPSSMAPACLLRIKAGTQSFDSSFYVNLLDKLGTQAVFQSWYLGNDKMLVLALTNGQSFTDVDDFYKNAMFTPLLVDTQGNPSPVSGLPVTVALNTYEFNYGGALIYQAYHGSITDRTVTLSQVGTEGSVKDLFIASGADFWGIGELTTH